MPFDFIKSRNQAKEMFNLFTLLKKNVGNVLMTLLSFRYEGEREPKDSLLLVIVILYVRIQHLQMT